MKPGLDEPSELESGPLGINALAGLRRITKMVGIWLPHHLVQRFIWLFLTFVGTRIILTVQRVEDEWFLSRPEFRFMQTSVKWIHLLKPLDFVCILDYWSSITHQEQWLWKDHMKYNSRCNKHKQGTLCGRRFLDTHASHLSLLFEHSVPDLVPLQ